MGAGVRAEWGTVSISDVVNLWLWDEPGARPVNP